MKDITKKVKDYKKKNGLTLDDMAPILGMSKKTLIKRLRLENWTKLENYFISNKIK